MQDEFASSSRNVNLSYDVLSIYIISIEFVQVLRISYKNIPPPTHLYLRMHIWWFQPLQGSHNR